MTNDHGYDVDAQVCGKYNSRISKIIMVIRKWHFLCLFSYYELRGFYWTFLGTMKFDDLKKDLSSRVSHLYPFGLDFLARRPLADERSF